VKNFRPRKSVPPSTTIYHAIHHNFTTIYHQETPQKSQNPCKNDPPPQKHFFQIPT
jgi:hypothetical protein